MYAKPVTMFPNNGIICSRTHVETFNELRQLHKHNRTTMSAELIVLRDWINFRLRSNYLPREAISERDV